MEVRNKAEVVQQLGLFASSGRGSSTKKLKPFLESSYSYMPLVWGATLAFWLGPALQEGGHILPVSLPSYTCKLLSLAVCCQCLLVYCLSLLPVAVLLAVTCRFCCHQPACMRCVHECHCSSSQFRDSNTWLHDVRLHVRQLKPCCVLTCAF